MMASSRLSSSMPRRILSVLACAAIGAVPLSACSKHAATPRTLVSVVDTQWTDAAAKRTETLSSTGKIKYSLPQLRIYDAKGELVYSLDPATGWKPTTIGSALDKAIAAGHPIPGPSLNETLADLQTADGRPARGAVAVDGAPLVFDYWASWCVPCKILEKALLQWQATKPRGSVRIVKAETDLMKFERAQGQKTYMVKKGPDGRLHKFEMK
jgi:thiol-disulfide isomerase/thioredoxin